jgi:hypothetical protein
LESITIPASVIKIYTSESSSGISSSIVAGCTNLSSINVSEDNPNYSSNGGVLFNKEQTILLAYPCGKSNTYTVPDGVEKIETGAFAYSSNLTNVDFPNTLTEIGKSAFSQCTSLAKIELPDSVTTINNYAFDECTALEDIKLSDNLTSIGALAFRKCTALKEITIPSGITAISGSTFFGCESLETVNLPKTVTEIMEGAFYHCTSLKNIDFSNLTIIGIDAFNGCEGFEEITFPETLSSIGADGFYNCINLKKVTFLGFSSMGGVVFENDPVTIYGYDGTRVQRMALNDGYNYVVIDPAINEVTATSNGDEISVNVDSYFTQGGDLLVSSYTDDGVLIDMKKVVDGSAALNGNADNVKVFFWKSIDSMTPLCDVKSTAVE